MFHHAHTMCFDTAARGRLARIALCLGAVALVSACVTWPAAKKPAAKPAAPPVADAPAAKPAAPAKASERREYTISPGDVVRITVYDHPDLGTVTRVSETGRVNLALVGEVPVTGVTPPQAAARIAARLRDGKFIKNAQVSVFVERHRSPLVSILGEVQRPGKFPLRDPNTEDIRTVSDLLAAAGGVNANAADYATLIKKGEKGTTSQRIDLIALLQRGDMNQNVAIDAGDVLHVPRTPLFYIYGEVQRPGTYRLERDMTLMQALAVGGGPNQRGTTRGIEIRRRNGDGSVTTKKAKLTETLQPEDVIYVKESLF